MSQISFETIATSGIRLHTACAGPNEGDPVVLLHGFPDAWFGWRAQIEALADAGFRVIVPDQRGYNLSDKPKGVTSYRMAALVADILGLADALGYSRFHLAGHDFGALVSWNLAMQHPERLKRLAIANGPHPAIIRDYARTHPSQRRKSWYAFFFQLPALPEYVVRARNWQLLISAMPGGLTESERDRYRQAWARPKAMTSMINWYRAGLRPSRTDGSHPQSTPPARIRVPTLVLWGQQDPHISYEMAPLSAAMCEHGRLVTFEDAAHWVQHDKPQQVSKLLIEHFFPEGPR